MPIMAKLQAFQPNKGAIASRKDIFTLLTWNSRLYLSAATRTSSSLKKRDFATLRGSQRKAKIAIPTVIAPSMTKRYCHPC